MSRCWRWGATPARPRCLIDRLLALVERRRRNTETGVAAVLLLRVAEIAERDLGDDARALDLLRRADEVEPRSLVVLTGLGHLAQKRGDGEECERIAARLAELARAAAGPADAAEALYRAAALELPLKGSGTAASPSCAPRWRRTRTWSEPRRWSRPRAWRSRSWSRFCRFTSALRGNRGTSACCWTTWNGGPRRRRSRWRRPERQSTWRSPWASPIGSTRCW